MNLSIANKTDFDIARDRLRDIIGEVLNNITNRNQDTLSIAFVTNSEMARLHEEYYGKSGATDVLAFGYEDESGEIVLAPSYIRERTEPSEETATRQMIQTIIHGILHLNGYDHTSNTDNGAHRQRERELLDMLSLDERSELVGTLFEKTITGDCE